MDREKEYALVFSLSVSHSIDFHLLIPTVYNINKIAASLYLGFGGDA